MIYENIYKTIGKTPLVRINNIIDEDEAEILVKLESFNPSGSIKDRAALNMIEEAEKEEKLKKDGTIIEATSGNMGIALSMIASAKGYKVKIVMPETMSKERRLLMEAYGAEVILTDGKLGMQGSVDKAEELSREKGYFLADQFKNVANKLAHYENTAIEIYEDTGGKIDAFVAGVGTGGTVSGVGRKLKDLDKNIKIYAGQPESSRVLTGEEAGSHKLQGLGANFIPEIYDEEYIDGVINISDEEAYKYARLLGKKEGILAGISSGANLAAAKKLAKELGKGKRVVTVLPDTGERYLSTDLYTEDVI